MKSEVNPSTAGPDRILPSASQARLGAALMLMAAMVVGTMVAPAWAAPTVRATTINPVRVQVGVTTDVRITAEILDRASAQVLEVTALRVKDNGSVSTFAFLKDDGSNVGPDRFAGDGIYAGVASLKELAASTITLRVRVKYVLKNKTSGQFTTPDFSLLVGEFFDADTATGGAVQGVDVTVTVPQNFTPWPAFVSAKRGSGASVVADTGGKGIAAVVDLTVDNACPPPPAAVPGCAEPIGELENPRNSVDVQLPTTLPDGTEIVVARQLVVDTVTFGPGGTFIVGAPTTQLVPVAMATVAGSTISTVPSDLPGINTTGKYAFLDGAGSGFASGVVTQGTVPQGGVVVSNSTNSLVAVTNDNGQYTLFVDAGPTSPIGTSFTVHAFHPLRGSVGSATGVITTDLETVTTNVTVTAPTAPVNTRPGIRNGGFERGDLTSWIATGSATVEEQFGPTGPYVPPSGTLCKQIRRNDTNFANICAPSAWGGAGTVITAPEGQFMARLSTGGAAGGASLKQVFRIPPGAAKLRIDYNYITTELPEWLGKPFQDPFRVFITPQGGTPTDTACGTPASPPCRAVQVTVNSANAGGIVQIGDCLFPDGDTSCAQTGWKTVEVDLSAVNATTNLELLFTLANGGDAEFQTEVLIDNIRFETIWVDAKILQGAQRKKSTGLVDMTPAQVESDIRNANEILSQAGFNLRLRPVQIIPNPAGLLDIDVTHQLDPVSPNCTKPTSATTNQIVLGDDGVALTNKRLTADERALMNVARSAIATDYNVYYVRSATGVSGVKAFTANPGDFCTDVVAPSLNLGSMLTNNATDFTLAHEFGHGLQIAVSDSTLMHEAPAGSFTVGSPATGVVQSSQSNVLQGTPNAVP